MSSSPNPPTAPAPFSEKGFYLEEFHGKTLAVAAPAAELRQPGKLVEVMDELARNEINVILISTERSALEPLVGENVLSMATPRLEGTVWRKLHDESRLGLVVGGSLAFAPACREAAVRLGIAKLVWIDRDGGLLRENRERISFVHLDELREILGSGAPANQRRTALLREVEAMLVAGVPAVNVCTLEGLADELFTYAGSGTLFTEERYMIVRRLVLDDYDAASDLIARGTAEGYLAARSPEQHDLVLASGFGAFVEGQHLAGIGALLVDETTRSAEIASLYTLTRFLGEGVGGHLVAYALARARERGLEFVYACTTSERVGAFFERHAFHVAGPGDVPVSKWRGYDPDRRTRVACYRMDLADAASKSGATVSS
ncbi:MAG: GNAT family N-acetyltransferase [Deltaproteobacteria bacterium]|nr:GNAT family N-acetyltransferase [Deltaproteobacteria bacterium]